MNQTGRQMVEATIDELKKVLRDVRLEAQWDPAACSLWSCIDATRRTANALSICTKELHSLHSELRDAAHQMDREREASA